MRFNYSEPNQQQKPDIHDLLSLLQFTSPEAQQERQGQLQLLQARLGTEQGTQAHEAAMTQQLQALTAHLPDEWQQQAAELAARTGASNASAAAETTRNALLSGQVANQPTEFANQNAEVQARVGLLHAQATKTDEIDPQKVMMDGALVKQATNDPVLAKVLQQSRPELYSIVQGQHDQQQQALTDKLNLAAQTKQASGAPITANQLGQNIGSVPMSILNTGYDIPNMVDRGTINPVNNFLRGLVGAGPTPPALPPGPKFNSLAQMFNTAFN